ncbi:MAG: hypothetical protein ICV83_19235, partial [Cytophagales bacterium]|nr:hypothetical protein [Cytophagales bacterium]
MKKTNTGWVFGATALGALMLLAAPTGYDQAVAAASAKAEAAARSPRPPPPDKNKPPIRNNLAEAGPAG